MKQRIILFFLFLFLSISTAIAAPVIESKIGEGGWVTKNAIYPLKGQKVQLRVKPVRDSAIEWFQIVPDISVRYHNAGWPWKPNAYQWLGFDKIKYTKKKRFDFQNKWTIELFPGNGPEKDGGRFFDKKDSLVSYILGRLFPSEGPGKSHFYRADAGSFWFQAVIKKGEKTYATPGMENRDNRGLSPSVFRVSVRSGNDLLGHLTSYFNVPAVFGSIPYQVKHHIGVDCADVLMAAWSRSKNRPIRKDYNVAMLTRKFPRIKKFNIVDGRPDTDIHWKKEIRPGDFLAVKYNKNSRYQHIGALYEDENQNGILDKRDLVLHAGPDPLHFSPLDSGVFDGQILVVRPD